MLEYVKDLGLKPKHPYAVRKVTDLIIEHHASGKTCMTDAEAEDVIRSYHNSHIAKGNRGIDYNFLVAGNGSVFKGRGLEYEGGHVLNDGKSAGMNARSVGICALGDFERNQMPQAQKDAIARLTRDVAQHYGIKDIIKHKDVKATDCPGKNYPFDEICEYALSTTAGGGSGMYVTTRTAEIYRRDSPRPTIGAGNELELLEYSGGKWAQVKNPATGNEFIIEFDALRQK